MSELQPIVMAVQNNTALIHFQGYYKPSFIFWSFLHTTQSQTSCITMNSFQDTTSHILLSHSLMFTLHFIFYSSLFTTQCSYFSMYVLFNYFIHFCFTAIYLKHVSLIFPLYMLPFTSVPPTSTAMGHIPLHPSH